ncbi:MAG: phage major capsid protein [Acidimicrobiales bacterium]
MKAKELRKLRRMVETERSELLDAAGRLVDAAASDTSTAGEVEFALARVEQLDRRLESLPRVERIREPDIYEPGGPHSFLLDLVATVSPLPVRGMPDPLTARDRLVRHSVHEASGRQLRGVQARYSAFREGMRAPQPGPGQSRALSNAAGAGGEFLPPRWMVEAFASVARAAAPLCRLVRSLPLPDDCMELYLPRVTAVSGVVEPVVTENTNAPQVESATDMISAQVATFAGEVVVSQQLHDRSDMDRVLLTDMAESYGSDLEAELLGGPGTAGRMLGLLNVASSPVDGVPGATAASYTDSSPSPAKMVNAIGALAAEVAQSRLRPPNIVLVRPERFFWVASGLVDAGGEPAQRVGTGYHSAKGADDGPYGPVAGLPVYLDGNLPVNGAQDLAVVVRTNDLILLEDDAPAFDVMVDTSGGASQLAVVVRYHRYAAAFTSRYPAGIGTVTGTGFAYPPVF